MLARDDGRTSLPGSLRPGATCRLPLTIKAPLIRSYQCEVDLVHEGVAWFQGLGSTVVRFVVRTALDEAADDGSGQTPVIVPAPPQAARHHQVVQAPTIAGINTEVDDPGDFPMHGMPLDSVVALIADQGVTLLHVENDRSCGDDWVSYRIRWKPETDGRARS